MLLQNGTLEQEQEVPNGYYSISFYYQKLNQLCNASVVINDVEYPLESMEVKQFYTGEKDNETGEFYQKDEYETILKKWSFAR